VQLVQNKVADRLAEVRSRRVGPRASQRAAVSTRWDPTAPRGLTRSTKEIHRDRSGEDDADEQRRSNG